MTLAIRDYRLVTAEILYGMPDYPGILQAFVWQDMDLFPSLPGLVRFLGFWKRELQGPLHSVRLACGNDIRTASIRHTGRLILH